MTKLASAINGVPPHLMRDVMDAIVQIRLPDVRATALNVVKQFCLIACHDPQFSFSVSLGRNGRCAALLTNRRNETSPAGCNYVDIDECNVFIAYGPNDSCSGKGTDADAVSSIASVIASPLLPTVTIKAKQLSLASP